MTMTMTMTMTMREELIVEEGPPIVNPPTKKAKAKAPAEKKAPAEEEGNTHPTSSCHCSGSGGSMQVRK